MGTLLLRKVFHLRDISVILIAMISQSASIYCMAFAHTSEMIYISATVGWASSLSYSATVAFAAHLSSADEVKLWIFAVTMNGRLACFPPVTSFCST